MPKKRHFQRPMPPVRKGDDRPMSDDVPPDSADLFRLLKAHRYAEAIELIPAVGDVNVVDPKTGFTALHWGAAHRVRGVLNALWQRDDLDELARDRQGQYASELAWQIATDEELGVELMQRERDYGARHDLDVWPKPGNF